MDNGRTDNIFQSYRDDLIAIIRKIMDAGDFFDSEEYRVKTANNCLFFHMVFDHTQWFLDAVKGTGAGTAAGFKVDLKNWNLPARFFGLNSTRELPEDKRKTVDDFVARCFYYGLLYHLYAWNSPDTASIERIDFTLVAREWAPKSFNSYGELRAYDDNSNYIPSRIFTYFHEHAIRPVYKEWKFGYFKKIKAEAFFQRLFFAGCLFAVKAVDQTAKQ